jgi:hypothetical protein
MRLSWIFVSLAGMILSIVGPTAVNSFSGVFASLMVASVVQLLWPKREVEITFACVSMSLIAMIATGITSWAMAFVHLLLLSIASFVCIELRNRPHTTHSMAWWKYSNLVCAIAWKDVHYFDLLRSSETYLPNTFSDGDHIHPINAALRRKPELASVLVKDGWEIPPLPVTSTEEGFDLGKLLSEPADAAEHATLCANYQAYVASALPHELASAPAVLSHILSSLNTWEGEGEGAAPPLHPVAV